MASTISTGAAGRASSSSRRRSSPARAAADPKYREAARRSGLDDWHQAPREAGGPGYVEVEILARDDENPPEREKLRHVMKDLQSRGYGWGDIALLAQKNSDVVRATSWLNDMGVPFISFSSLDVRTRTVAGEMLALLSFLDSPPDDLAFATFVLGRIFARALPGQAKTGRIAAGRAKSASLREQDAKRPLYKAFQRKFPDLWKACFRRALPFRGVPAAVRPGERGLRALRTCSPSSGRRRRPSPSCWRS